MLLLNTYMFSLRKEQITAKAKPNTRVEVKW